MTLTLKSSPKVKIFEAYQLRKTCQNMLGNYARHNLLLASKVKVKVDQKGQIHLVAITSLIVTDFELGSYFSL